ncbi:hypothetical protein H4582DRAFT_985469 [Lactarius indigo]|nr:hypothetical protein H4582DRAFT_985469 [Lactarius indigo]
MLLECSHHLPLAWQQIGQRSGRKREGHAAVAMHDISESVNTLPELYSSHSPGDAQAGTSVSISSPQTAAAQMDCHGLTKPARGLACAGQGNSFPTLTKFIPVERVPAGFPTCVSLPNSPFLLKFCRFLYWIASIGPPPRGLATKSYSFPRCRTTPHRFSHFPDPFPSESFHPSAHIHLSLFRHPSLVSHPLLHRIKEHRRQRQWTTCFHHTITMTNGP